MSLLAMNNLYKNQLLVKQIVLQGSYIVLAHAVFDTVTCHKHMRLVRWPQAKLKLSQAIVISGQD